MRKREREEESKYTLPDEKTSRKKELKDYSILLFGEKKCGKTTLAAQFDDPFFFLCEPGEGDEELFMREINSWEEILGYTRALKKAPEKFKTLVIDTADLAFQYCQKYVCEKMGIDHPGDEGYGKGWNALKLEFSAWVNRILKLGRGVVFLSHATEKEIKRLDGTTSDKIVPTLSGQAREILDAVCDIIAYYTYDAKGRRVLRIRGSADIAAGHRCQSHFVGISEVRMGKNAKQAYANFVEAFETTEGEDDSEEEEGGERKKKKRVVVKL
jgi:hypothetical protein